MIVPHQEQLEVIEALAQVSALVVVAPRRWGLSTLAQVIGQAYSAHGGVLFIHQTLRQEANALRQWGRQRDPNVRFRTPYSKWNSEGHYTVAPYFDDDDLRGFSYGLVIVDDAGFIDGPTGDAIDQLVERSPRLQKVLILGTPRLWQKESRYWFREKAALADSVPGWRTMRFYRAPLISEAELEGVRRDTSEDYYASQMKGEFVEAED